MQQLSTTILTLSLVLIPLAIWIEDSALETWTQRLAIPNIESEPNRHTPLHTTGTYLPPIINQDTELTSEEGPFLLAANTQVSPTATLTIQPGTVILAHEFAQLTIDGTLNVNGTTSQPIKFTTNEAHPLNQTWGGIIALPNSTVNIQHANFHYASPALTCQTNSQATISNSTITQTAMGIFTTSQNCSVANSIIRSTQNGIVAVNTETTLINNTITAADHDVRMVNTKY